MSDRDHIYLGFWGIRLNRDSFHQKKKKIAKNKLPFQRTGFALSVAILQLCYVALEVFNCLSWFCFNLCFVSIPQNR